MVKITVTVKNKAGLHARPSSLIVKTCAIYNSEVYIGREGNLINAKSIMGVLTLGAGFGTELIIQAVGEDEAQVTEKLALLFDNKFANEE